MKVEKKLFKEFLSKVQMEAGQQIQECVLGFEEQGLKINANSPANQSRVMGWLKTTGFKEYSAIGNLAISSFDKFINIVNRFNENIAISTEGNILKMKEGKSWEYNLTDINFVSTDNKEPELEFSETFNFPAGKLQEIFEDVKLIKDAVLTVKTEAKKVTITSKGDATTVTHPIQADTCKGGVEVKFGEAFVEATKRLTGVLEVSMSTDYPVKVLERTEHSVVTLIVAPRVDPEK